VPKLIIPGDAKEAAGIAPKVIAQYRRFIDRLPEKKAGFLQFSAKEDIGLGREALLEAAGKSKKYIKIRKARGQDRTLQLQRCTKAEWDKANKTAQASTKSATKGRGGRKRGQKTGSKAKAQQAAAAAAPQPTDAQPADAPQAADASDAPHTSEETAAQE